MNAVIIVVALVGFFFVLAGVIGVLRLPDFYSRLHAMGKCDTVGVALLLGALALQEGPSLVSAKILLIVICMTFCCYKEIIQVEELDYLNVVVTKK